MLRRWLTEVVSSAARNEVLEHVAVAVRQLSATVTGEPGDMYRLGYKKALIDVLEVLRRMMDSPPR